MAGKGERGDSNPSPTSENAGKTSDKLQSPSEGGTESGTLDAGLARMTAVWPTLSPTVREQILILVEPPSS